MHWAEPYIGLPYDEKGRADDRDFLAGGPVPEAFHCWSFVRFAEGRHFGRELPAVPHWGDPLANARAFRDHEERRHWERVDTPAEGDIVLMGRSARLPIHAGVWVAAGGGRVVHCTAPNGVMAQRPADLAVNGWAIEGFYRYRGDGEWTRRPA